MSDPRIRNLPRNVIVSKERILAYVVSDEFQKDITQGAGSGIHSKVMALHFLMDNIALEPLSVRQIIGQLSMGVVNITFFGISNPIPVFELPEGDLLDSLRIHVDTNLKSRKFDAALRVRSWRSGAKSVTRRLNEDAVLAKLRTTLSWPDKTMSETDPKGAQLLRDNNYATVELKRLELRNRRSLRLAKLGTATAPSVTSWHNLLDSIVLKVLPPLR